MKEKNNIWTKTPFVFLFAFICCFLWGSAFPCIKYGYGLFGVPAGDAASQILFAGIRFFFAGVMVIIAGSLINHRVLKLSKMGIPKAIALSMFQTFGQYFFFYIGLAHASGVSSSVIEASNTFFAILIAAFVFRTENLTLRKIAGCILGFAGVILIQLNGASLSFNFSFMGEGFVLISALLSAFSSSFIKKWSADEDTVAMSGYQFMIGGAILAIGGVLAGGRLDLSRSGASGALLLCYMAFISACAYTLWSLLLKYNPVSRITIYGFMNPVIGVLLSAVILGEYAQAFRLSALFSLILVSLGIVVVNRKKS
ncbi:MAG: DMT family transporter [Lachnospiraceae bacterium]|nr:DMT family transporter [Lachnospiraceae bacterium]